MGRGQIKFHICEILAVELDIYMCSWEEGQMKTHIYIIDALLKKKSDQIMHINRKRVR